MGQGLYLSTSATDLMDRGEEVLAAVLPAGTPVLMIEPTLFSVGFPELLDMALRRLAWHWEAPDGGPPPLRPAPEVIDSLLEELSLPACAYVLGMHLAIKVVDGRCLRLLPANEQVRSVADYVDANPKDRPMMVSQSTIQRWIRTRVPG